MNRYDPVEAVLERLRGVTKRNGYWTAFCPAHDNNDTEALSVLYLENGNAKVKCHAGCSYGEIMAALGMKPQEGFADYEPGRNGKRRTPTSRSWKVKDTTGHVVAVHHRQDTPSGKKTWWERPDGTRGLGGLKVSGLPLYGAHNAHSWPEDAPVVVVEGEKAADALRGVYEAVLGTATGAASTPGPEALEVLRGRTVVLWPDNDDVGRRHMQRIGERLRGVAAEVRLFEWPGAPPKGDAADHPAVIAGDHKRVSEMLHVAPVYEPDHERSAPVGKLLSEVESERVSWLWPGRIPLGKLTIIEGDPGLGKSALTTDLAARMSVGRPLPDGAPCEASGVVLCSAEDGLADTIKPRLEAAGGDPTRVLSLAMVPDGDAERLLSIPDDLEVIRRGIGQVGARLVVVDPLSAFLSGDVNMHKDQEVRRALAPLAKLAEETGAAVVVLRHHTKTPGGNPLYRGGGSIGIVGAARSAMLVAPHPEDETRRVLAPLKSNLAEPVPSLVYALVGAANGAVRVEWKGESPLDAAALLAAPLDEEERRENAALRDSVTNLLRENGGRWEGEPSELHDALAERSLAGLPDRPDELTKVLRKLARTGGAFTVSRAWRKHDNRSRRTLRLHQPPNDSSGVDGVDRCRPQGPGLHHDPSQKPDRNGKVYTDNTDSGSRVNGVDPPGRQTGRVNGEQGASGGAEPKPSRCIHDVAPDDCAVCSGTVRRLIREGVSPDQDGYHEPLS